MFLQRLFNGLLFGKADPALKEAKNPEIGMSWLTPSHVFTIADIHSNNEVTLVEHKAPKQITRVKWPDYFNQARADIPKEGYAIDSKSYTTYYDVHYKGKENLAPDYIAQALAARQNYIDAKLAANALLHAQHS